MSRPDRLVWACPALALLLSGCATNAVKPPTPATNLTLDPNEPPPPCEHYYVLIWVAQRVPKTPASSHNFVTVVHTAEPVKVLDVHTISWLPATLDVRPFVKHPEPGVNLTLRETLEYTDKKRVFVSLWGPYECRPSFYKRFLVQKQFM